MLRAFNARYVTRQGGARDRRVEAAFVTVPREVFVGPAPWFLYPASASVPVPAYMRRAAAISVPAQPSVIFTSSVTSPLAPLSAMARP